MNILCINLAPLNKVTIPDKYPLPNIDEMLTNFYEATIFTTLDLAAAYWQIMLRNKDKAKTAFLTRNGQYQFRVMSFGLNNALATFQKLMNKILRKYLYKFCIVYFDDIIIYSRNVKEHRKHVKLVLQAIKEAGLKMKLSKCKWFQEELTFVGYVINKEGIKLDTRNLDKIREAPRPEDQRGIRRFLRMCQYY